MPDSAAERARRARRHRGGDHSLCDPSRRCELIEQTETMEAVAGREAAPGRGYGPRGSDLRVALADLDLSPLHAVLAEEACRIADRLDRLDGALTDKGTWLRQEVADGGTIVITVDGVLAEARQQASTLRGLVAEIRSALPKQQAAKPVQPARRGGGLGDLNARIAARRASAPSAG